MLIKEPKQITFSEADAQWALHQRGLIKPPNPHRKQESGFYENCGLGTMWKGQCRGQLECYPLKTCTRKDQKMPVRSFRGKEAGDISYHARLAGDFPQDGSEGQPRPEGMYVWVSTCTELLGKHFPRVLRGTEKNTRNTYIPGMGFSTRRRRTILPPEDTG